MAPRRCAALVRANKWELRASVKLVFKRLLKQEVLRCRNTTWPRLKRPRTMPLPRPMPPPSATRRDREHRKAFEEEAREVAATAGAEGELLAAPQ